jgi:hypothetical protein
MRLNHSPLGPSLLLISILTACSLPQANPTTNPGLVATKVAATLASFTQSAVQTPINSTPITQTVQPTANAGTPTLPTATTGFTNTPTNTQNPTVTIGATPSPTLGLGTIAGSISGYPYGSIPSLAIVAFGQEPPYRYWYWITGGGSTSYSMDGYITTGHYQVVAYDSSGHAGGCTVTAQVLSNQTVTCDITDWGGGYPAKPSGVPTP